MRNTQSHPIRNSIAIDRMSLIRIATSYDPRSGGPITHSAERSVPSTMCRYAHGRRTSDAGSGPNNIPKAPDEYSGINVEDGLSSPSPTPYNFFAQQKTAATNFLIGGNFPANPDAIKQAQFLYGADLGFHAWYHTVQTPLSNEDIVVELGWTIQITTISAAASPPTGVVPRRMTPTPVFF
ncbi:hypothetical protein A4X06_0g9059 [Tilletia controversa]|uniref:chitin deacetylase n=1 Tax=Tilletia controversa TaxID=13291 RepID=A0A8X7MJ88_9BASI|nr:hypothetical protein A4X06_0g9059 [Tilletia controversa]